MLIDIMLMDISFVVGNQESDGLGNNWGYFTKENATSSWHFVHAPVSVGILTSPPGQREDSSWENWPAIPSSTAFRQ